MEELTEEEKKVKALFDGRGYKHFIDNHLDPDTNAIHVVRILKKDPNHRTFFKEWFLEYIRVKLGIVVV